MKYINIYKFMNIHESIDQIAVFQKCHIFELFPLCHETFLNNLYISKQS